MAPKRRRGSQNEPGALPRWSRESLSTFPEHQQAPLYFSKLNDVKRPADRYITERFVNLDDFRPYQLVTGFERLGWLGALTINREGIHDICPQELAEWMATLRRDEGDAPPWTTRLTGFVHGTEVELSYRILRTIVDIDTLPHDQYTRRTDASVRGEVIEAEEYDIMIRELFLVPVFLAPSQHKLEASTLKPLPRLFYKILTWNVVPRTGDKGMVRKADIRPLYALVTGRNPISYYQLMMIHIWDAREKSEKKTIPYCRILTRLLNNARVVPDDSPRLTITAIPFDHAHLRQKEKFQFRETVTHFVLKDNLTGESASFLKPRRDQGGEEGEGGMDVEGEEEGRQFDFYGAGIANRAHPDRPPTYENWDPFQQAIYDHQQQSFNQVYLGFEEMANRQGRMARDIREIRARQDQIAETQARQEENIQMLMYYQQQYHHDDYEYSEAARRAHGYDYQMRRPDYYQGWHTQASSSSSQPPPPPDPLDMRSFSRSFYEDFFGQRYPRDQPDQ